MADKETKGFMKGGMQFGVGEDESPPEQDEGPLLPLRVLVLSGFVPSADYNSGASASETPLRLDLANPEQVFERLKPRATIEVPSVLAGGAPVKIDFAPTSLKSFRPDGMVTEIKLLRVLMEGRAVLERLRQGEITANQAQPQLERLWDGSPFVREILGLAPSADAPRPAFEAPPAPKQGGSSGGGDQVSSILDMVDLGDGGGSSAPESRETADPETANRLNRIIAEVARSARRTGPTRPSEAVPRVDQALGAQIGAILQHPEVRRLERAYRGLRFIQDRSQRIPGLLLDVLAIGEAGAAATFSAAQAKAGDVPYSFAIVDTEIDGSARSFTELLSIGETAEGNVVPALVNGTEKLLGVGDLSSIERIDNKLGLFTAPHRAPWRAVANKTALRWVALAMNGTLGRPPYDKQSSRVREAVIKEAPSDHEGYVWLSPVWALGALMIKSFQQTGWPGRIAGTKNGLVENLPVREIEEDGQTVAVPTQAFLSTDSQREMAKMGVLLLASAPNSDAAYVHVAPTAYVQPDKKAYDSATTEPEDRPPPIGLVDKLFVARLVQFTRALAQKISPDESPDDIRQLLDGAITALFGATGPSLSVKIEKTGGGPIAHISVEPRRFLGVALEEFGFQMPIG
ncbi:MAG: type VI secretion system contractile sheath large subunit [Polyangiaceae bacterium]